MQRSFERLGGSDLAWRRSNGQVRGKGPWCLVSEIVGERLEDQVDRGPAAAVA